MILTNWFSYNNIETEYCATSSIRNKQQSCNNVEPELNDDKLIITEYKITDFNIFMNYFYEPTFTDKSEHELCDELNDLNTRKKYLEQGLLQTDKNIISHYNKISNIRALKFKSLIKNNKQIRIIRLIKSNLVLYLLPYKRK